MGVGRRCSRVRDVTVSPRHLLKTKVNFALAKCYIRVMGYRGNLSREGVARNDIRACISICYL